MQWQAHFSIGDPEIDRQHQNLFTMVEHLKRSLNTNAMYDNMGKALKFMVEYTNSHFEKEEAYMQAIAYTGLASHRELHRNLAREVQNILLKIKQDKHVFPTELINLTTEMLLDHTLVEDLKIRRHLQEATRAQEASRLEMFRQFRQTTAGALDQVTRLHQKETVTEAAYQDKKQALLKAFVRIEPPIPME
ncbi:MAG: hemerythrin family protein, partial [Desulfatitalea sp.]|nr:bacteriohemerythrin [Desulfatitalea sp.]NNK01079.1 hemerythrin family protein [Desulfatitalea sp.]